MDLRENDYLVGVAAVQDDWYILSISENGFGKRTQLSEYRLTGRGAKGVINMKITPKIGKVVEVLPIKENADIMVITCNGQIIRVDSDQIRKTGRSAQGVRVVKMAEDDKVAAACLVPETEEDDKAPELPLQ
jgi:DNA gyrase subunit A